MKFRPKAQYLLPGSFFSEDQAVELPERSVAAAVEAAPEGAFCFRLYDSPIVDFEFDAGLFRVLPIPQNESHKHYIGGEVFTCDELRALAVEEGDPKKYDILIANVSTWTPNGYIDGRAIRCQTGNWQPFEEGDEVVVLGEKHPPT
jgi:hypothetical protein